MNNDLTQKEYWNQRQENSKLKNYEECSNENEWAKKIATRIDVNKKFNTLEIGCNPGYATVAVYKYIKGVSSGVDFNEHDQSFIDNLKFNSIELGNLYRCDVRSLDDSLKYDIVYSCGFVEHFSNIDEIIEIHANLMAEGGFLIIAIPNFRYIQYIYHWLFDREDLRMHNINVMDLLVLENSVKNANLDVIESGYAGKLKFWNYSTTGGFFSRYTKKILSKITRELAKIFSMLMPGECKYYSPWIYIIASKK